MDWIARIPDWLNGFLDDPQRLQLGYSALLGVSVFILAFAVYFVVTGVWDPLRKRVHSVKDAGVQHARKVQEKGPLETLGRLFVPRSDVKRGQTETLLRHAGFRSDGAMHLFLGFKLAATVLLPLLVVAVAGLTHWLPLADTARLLPVAGVLGFLIPELMLRRFARRRQDRLRRGLPDAMDLLVVCSEAGLGLNAGIQRVAGEITITHPDLAGELNLFSMQTRSGMDSRAALKDLEDRTGLEDIQALVATLLQSMRFGTSIADTLRIYSDELRDKRLQRAQEKAGRIGTLMLLPLALCILPSFLLVVVGPAVLNAFATVSGAGIFK